MSAYSDGYRNGLRGANWSEIYFGDDYLDYQEGLDDARQEADDDGPEDWEGCYDAAEEVGL